MGRQHQGMDRPGFHQVPESSGEQGTMEKTGCKIICGAPTTHAVKRLMMMMMMYYGDRVHLNPKGMLVWLRKVRTFFLELLPLSTQTVCKRAADHNHQPDERTGVHRVNRQRDFIEEYLPTASSISVVTGNRAEVHCLSADESSNVSKV